MPNSISLAKAYWIFVAAGGLYLSFVSILCIPAVQRHVLYLHKANTAWLWDLNEPEQWGFLTGQTRPFRLNTTDAESLYGWYILPESAVNHGEALELESNAGRPDLSNIRSTYTSKTRVVVSFHGNAGDVAQNWRTQFYHSLLGIQDYEVHVVAFDYRGFGLSTGVPSEEGLIQDGVDVVDWVLQSTGLPSSQVILIGHSLGTAVSTAVADRFAQRGTEFGGLLLLAPFSDLTTLLSTYTLFGIVPVMGPLKYQPRINNLVMKYVYETWDTETRLRSLVQRSRELRVHVMHAFNDFDIPWTHAARLYAVAGGDEGENLDFEVKSLEREGVFRTKMTEREGRRAHTTLELLRHGGHNRIITAANVRRAVKGLLDREKMS